MKIFLIRHGQTTSDVEDRYGGDYDDHLTPLGEKQAKELSTKIKDLGIEVIFSSPKVRAQETAQILNQKLNVSIETEVDLRERNFYGKLTAMKKAEAKERYPELVEMLKNSQNTIDGAEPWEEFVNRVVEAFKKISKLDYTKVAIVTHGGPIRRIFAGLLNIDREIGGIEIQDCAVAEINADENSFELVRTEGISY